eukprot:6730553-Alexandrium_andersonii.AAC.1
MFVVLVFGAPMSTESKLPRSHFACSAGAACGLRRSAELQQVALVLPDDLRRLVKTVDRHERGHAIVCQTQLH